MRDALTSIPGGGEFSTFAVMNKDLREVRTASARNPKTQEIYYLVLQQTQLPCWGFQLLLQ